MGGLKIFSGIVLLLSIGIGFFIYNFTWLPELPKMEVSYWGSGLGKPDDMSIMPFKINIPASSLNELKIKLEKTRPLTPPLEETAWTYGINTDYLNKFVDFWKTKYNWTEREIYLNTLPQYTTQIGGLQIHFIHAKPDVKQAKGKKILPLLILHGWPGSVREFYEIIPMLTTPRPDADFVFEVIAPSLPGYGFSEGATKTGLGVAHMGTIFNELMVRLGYDKYYIQGGDWGSSIGYSMAILFKERVLAYHSNYCSANTANGRFYTLISYLFPNYFVEEGMRDKFVNQFFDVYIVGMGYLHIQATKPDTIGVALTDSPVGLAAYLLEKFSGGTNRNYKNLPDGGIEKYDKVKFLDDIMIYWLTKSITTSMRLYAETLNRKYQSLAIEKHQITVPTGCARFPNEIFYYPQIVLEANYPNLVSISDFPTGGHFAALEQPQLLADEIWKFIKIARNPISQMSAGQNIWSQPSA